MALDDGGKLGCFWRGLLFAGLLELGSACAPGAITRPAATTRAPVWEQVSLRACGVTASVPETWTVHEVGATAMVTPKPPADGVLLVCQGQSRESWQDVVRRLLVLERIVSGEGVEGLGNDAFAPLDAGSGQNADLGTVRFSARRAERGAEAVLLVAVAVKQPRAGDLEDLRRIVRSVRPLPAAAVAMRRKTARFMGDPGSGEEFYPEALPIEPSAPSGTPAADDSEVEK